MIELWEALGRLAYEKGLFSNFEEVLGKPEKIPWIKLDIDGYPVTCLQIPQDRYKNVQHFLAPKLNERLLSLISAGELIWIFGSKKVRDAFQDLAAQVQAQPLSAEPSTSYFIGLGLSMIDRRYRQALEKGADGSVPALARLPKHEREQLTGLYHNPRFKDPLAIVESLWDAGCDADMMPYFGYAQPIGCNRERRKDGTSEGSNGWSAAAPAKEPAPQYA